MPPWAMPVPWVRGLGARGVPLRADLDVNAFLPMWFDRRPQGALTLKRGTSVQLPGAWSFLPSFDRPRRYRRYHHRSLAGPTRTRITAWPHYEWMREAYPVTRRYWSPHYGLRRYTSANAWLSTYRHPPFLARHRCGARRLGAAW